MGYEPRPYAERIEEFFASDLVISRPKGELEGEIEGASAANWAAQSHQARPDQW